MSSTTGSTSTTEYITPSAAARLVTQALADQGVTDPKTGELKKVRPQMMVNYTSGRVKKGEKPFIAWTAETGIDRADLVRWLKQYIAKQTAKAELEPLDLGEADEVEVDEEELESVES